MRRGLVAIAVAAVLVVAGVVVWTQSSGDRTPVGALETSSEKPVTLEMHGGVPRFVQADVPVEGATPADRSYAFLERHSELYALDTPQEELDVVSVEEGPDLSHVHLQQRRGEVPVYGGDLVVHLAGDRVIATNGSYLADLPALEPKLEASSALQVALEAAGVKEAGELKPELTYFDADLLMTPEEREANKLDGETRLAWKVDVDGTDGEGRAVAKRTFVDAETGEMLLAYDLIFEHAPAKNLWIRTADGASSAAGQPCRFPDAVEWFGRTGVIQGATPDAEGTGAFQHLNAVYDYFFDRFHRHSYDGSERMVQFMLDAVETWLPAPNAAYWATCEIFYFTDNMASLDVVAHEIAHGVTHSSVAGGLTYAFQPGAIHESTSDTFGVLIDAANWTLIEATASTQFRDYRDPRRSQQFTPPRGQPDAMPAEVFTAMVDNGGVHQNSGIPNKFGYLLMAGGFHNRRYVSPIGREKTARLWLEVVDNWLTTTSRFEEFRNAMIGAVAAWAAAGTNGFSAADACRVRNALAAVGLAPGDADCDGTLDDAEADADGDGIANESDNCEFVSNPTQIDFDGDGVAAGCDPDEQLTPQKPLLTEAIARRTEQFERIQIPVIPCLERCEPEAPMEITLDVDSPLEIRLKDDLGNVVAEGSSTESLVFEPKPDLEYSLEILPREVSLDEGQRLELELRPRP